jgi:hypothetical protein
VTLVPLSSGAKLKVNAPLSPWSISGPSVPCRITVFPGSTKTTCICCTPPPAGNDSHQHPPARSSSRMFSALCEKLCSLSHQWPTSRSAAYARCGAAFTLAVSTTSNPLAEDDFTAAPAGAAAIKQPVSITKSLRMGFVPLFGRHSSAPRKEGQGSALDPLGP